MTSSLNNTIIMAVDVVMEQPAPLWMKGLALLGGVTLFQFALSNMLNVIYFCAYAYGLIKWLLRKND